MARKHPVRIIGKHAPFNVEAWARAIESLAVQLHREWRETGRYPQAPQEDEEPRETC